MRSNVFVWVIIGKSLQEELAEVDQEFLSNGCKEEFSLRLNKGKQNIRVLYFWKQQTSKQTKLICFNSCPKVGDSLSYC